MLTRFIKAVHKNSIVWFVVGETVIQGALRRHLSGVDGEIMSVSLRGVTVRNGDAQTEVESLIIPAFRISAWGTDDETFDHLAP